MHEWLNKILENERISFVLGGVIVFVVNQLWRIRDRKDKITKEKFSELKTIKKLNLTNKAHAVNRDLTRVSFKADDNSSEIHKDLQGICYNHNAHYSWLLKLSNGGDHIDEWSKKLVTIVAEETLPGIDPQSKYWQSVPVLQTMLEMMKKTFHSEDKYYYVSDIHNELPDSDFKSLIDERTMDVGLFYVGSVKEKIYFILCQFRRDGIQSLREKTQLKLWAQKTGKMLFKTNLELEVLKTRHRELIEEMYELEELKIPKK